MLCLLNRGLLGVAYSVPFACSFFFHHPSNPMTPVENELPPSNKLALGLLIKNLADYVRGMYKRVAIPSGYPFDGSQQLFADLLCLSMTAFIISHEIGHAILGHVRPDPDWSPSKVGRLLHLCDQGTNERHRCEFDADRQAQAILDLVEPYPFSRLGGICALYSMLFVGVVDCKLTGGRFEENDESDSHPSTVSRIAELRSAIDHSERGLLVPDEREVCDMFEELYLGLQRATVERKDGRLHVNYGGC